MSIDAEGGIEQNFDHTGMFRPLGGDLDHRALVPGRDVDHPASPPRTLRHQCRQFLAARQPKLPVTTRVARRVLVRRRTDGGVIGAHTTITDKRKSGETRGQCQAIALMISIAGSPASTADRIYRLVMR